MKKCLNVLKPLAATILFLSLMFTSYIPLSNMSRWSDDPSIVNSQIRIRQFYKQDKESIDVMYLGSSATYRYIIPPQNWKEQKFTSWIYASVGQPFEMTKYLMEEVEKTQSPKLYVVEMRQLVKKMEDELDGVPLSEGKQEYYYNSLFTAMPFTATRTKAIYATAESEPLSWVFDFTRHHNVWKNIKWKKVKKRMFSADPYKNNPDYKTYYKTNCVAASKVHKQFKHPQLDEVTESMKLSDYYQGLLDDTVNYIRDNNLNVLFVSSPYVESKRQRKIHNYLESYFELNGCNYINFNKHVDEIGIDYARDFSDYKHVNVAGQEKFNRYLSDYIVENYDVVTKHTDEQIKAWDKAAANWDSESKSLNSVLSERLEKLEKEGKL